MKGKVAVITGGSGTLGSVFINGLLEQGVKVFSLSRNEEAAKKMVEDFSQMGFSNLLTAIKYDVVGEEPVDKAAVKIIASEGRVDILINGAGGNLSGATVMPEQSIFDLSIPHFKKVNDLNLLGTIIPTIAFMKPMVKQGKGCIINISSMAAFLSLTGVVGYSSAKTAINNFTQWMAVEMANKYGS